MNRVEAVPVTLDGSYSAEVPPCHHAYFEGNCTSDDECNYKPHGYCELSGGNNGFPPICNCTYLCSDDADCSDGEVCLSPEAHDLPLVWPVCVEAECRTNSECPSSQCGVASIPNCGHGEAKMVCRTAMDECNDATDCSGGEKNCFSFEDRLVCASDACD